MSTSTQSTDLATFSVLLDGSAMPETYQVTGIRVTNGVNRIPAAELILLDGDVAKEDFALSNKAHFGPGTSIEIKAGYHSNEGAIFKGIIIGQRICSLHGRVSKLHVFCKDESVRMTHHRRTAYYESQSDDDIWRDILEKNKVKSSKIEITDIVHGSMVQYQCTDWDFILTRAEKNGMLVLVSDGTVSITPPSTDGDPVLKLEYGTNVLEFEAEVDARTQVKGVSGYSWDYANQETGSADAGKPAIEELGDFDADKLAAVLSPTNEKLKHSGEITNKELKRWADARLLRRRLGKVTGRVRCIGESSIKPGVTIEIKGFGNHYNGKAFVCGICHQMTPGTWETDIQFGLSPQWFSETHEIAEPAAASLVAPVTGLQIGVVTKLQDDPQGEHRIQVRLPAIAEESEEFWARVSRLDAGDNRGSFFMPEIGDEVVIGYVNNDPRCPVVLGMLNSSAKPAPIQGADDNHEKGFVSRSGMRLIFNDDKTSCTVETPKGNRIVLNDNDGSITFEDQNSNKISMKSDGIVIESAADLKIKAQGNIQVEGTEIEQKATSIFKADGGAGAELTTSAKAVIRGSFVQIN
jgi:Rhs element Vgr protein